MSTPTEPVPVVLIDDHAMFRQALYRLVSSDPRVRVVGVAEVMPDVRVLALTVSEEHEDVLEALRAVARIAGTISA